MIWWRIELDKDGSIEDTPDEGESDLSAALARVEAETARAEHAEAACKAHYEARQCAEQELEQALDAMGQATLMNRAESAEADLVDANSHLEALHAEFDLIESEAEALREEVKRLRHALRTLGRQPDAD